MKLSTTEKLLFVCKRPESSFDKDSATNSISVMFSRDPAVVGGEWVIDGTRITPGDVKYIYNNSKKSITRVHEAYPHLTWEQIIAATQFKTPRKERKVK